MKPYANEILMQRRAAEASPFINLIISAKILES
jgi:hypothetical protein